jgi:hypothetical protein
MRSRPYRPVTSNTALHLMDRQPDRARSALVTINEVSKQALVELRSVLGVLRAVDESVPRAPTPGLARLGDPADTAGHVRPRNRQGAVAFAPCERDGVTGSLPVH